jgi:hypothetical protein
MIVGVDPGVHTGFAVWDASEKRLHDVASHGIVEAMVRVEGIHRQGLLRMVVFEDARLRTWFGSKGREALQGAGSIRRESAIWAEWLAHLGCPFKAVSPKSRGPKLSSVEFQRLTGWAQRTNEHGRDAAQLVIGMK